LSDFFLYQWVIRAKNFIVPREKGIPT
jgi:hypothetical protein